MLHTLLANQLRRCVSRQLRAIRFALAFAVIGALWVSPSFAQLQPAPEENRKLAADVLRTALMKEARKLKLEGSVAARHEKAFLRWSAEAKAEAQFVEPDKNLRVDVPKMLWGTDQSALHIDLTTPLAGKVSAVALSEDNKVLAKAASDFGCKIQVSAEITVTRTVNDEGAHYQVKILKWSALVSHLQFNNPLAEILKGDAEKAINTKLNTDADKLRKIANDALEKAYRDGKLRFDN